MDEIFDSSMDTKGTDELMNLLQQLTSDSHVVIISHSGDQLFDKFDNVVKFTKTKNFSQMEA